MDRRARAIIIAFVIYAVLSTMPGATLQAPSPAAGGRAVFLEHSMVANGTVVQGKAPFKSVNFPTYWYNENTKQLNGKVDFPVNDSLIMVFGDALTLKGNFGGGTGNKLFGVYSLPVTADQAYVYSIDMAGNIAMNVNGKTFVLKPGESYSYTENETLREGNATIKVRYEHTYINHGFIEKSHIGTGAVSP